MVIDPRLLLGAALLGLAIARPARASLGAVWRGRGAPENDPHVQQLRNESVRAHSAWWHAKAGGASRARVREARRRFRDAVARFRAAWDEVEAAREQPAA